MIDRNENSLETLHVKQTSPHVIAVTGGSGLIGRRLLLMLVSTTREVRVLSRSGINNGEYTTVHGDLRDAESLRELVRGTQCVVHLGGVAHAQLNNAAEREAAYAVNVVGTTTLLQASLEAGVEHFVLMSSAHVYAGQQGMNLREDSATASDDGYAGMKLAAEAAALEAAEQGMAVTILRPCLNYGPGVRFNLQSLLRAVRKGLYVHVRGVNVLRSLASVDTVAAAIAYLLQRPEYAGIYNIADREPVPLEDWVNHLADMMNVRRPYSLPLGVLRAGAITGSTAAAIGLPAPLTRASLSKLITSFSLNTDKLAATGFVWPQTQEAVLQQMVNASK